MSANSVIVKLPAWILLTGLLIFLSLIDFKAMISAPMIQQDRFLHLLVFAFFMGVTRYLLPNLSMGWVAVLSFSIGLLIEVLQKYYTHGIRHFTLTDLFYNLMGIALGLILLILFRRFKAVKIPTTSR